jgi:hypothetical protein
MRAFEQYLNRRNITDAKAYFEALSITTDERLNEWCSNHDIEPPLVPLWDPVPQREEQASAKLTQPKKKSVTKRVTSPGDAEETWHIPAAERPLRKSTKGSSTKKRKTSK